MPGATLEQLLTFALDHTVDTLEKRRHGAGKPQRPPTDPHSRHVPAAVRHEVFHRDAAPGRAGRLRVSSLPRDSQAHHGPAALPPLGRQTAAVGLDDLPAQR